MYKNYFALSEAPFSIAPDPRYLYMSEQHQEALAHLLYGVQSDGGFVLLTGEVGTGKTTICRCLLEKLPEHCDVAFIYNPRLTENELLATICTEFAIDVPPGTTSIKVFVDHINAYLLQAHANGRKSVLIIDEAQNLSVGVLEQLRLLTNLETNERKLLQIILLGQPELQQLLAKPELRQVAQRVIARYHLRPLSKAEVAAYVNHRVAVAGGSRRLFSASTLRQLYRLSGGVPRVINLLGDRALLGTYAQGKEKVNRATVAQAAREVFGDRAAGGVRTVGRILALLALFSGGMALALAYYKYHRQPDIVKPAGAPATAAEVPAPASTAPVSRPMVAAQLDALQWPKDVTISASEATAYAAIFKLWGVEYQKGASPCAAAESHGLRCLAEHGGLHQLRQFDVPAVLPLRTAGGKFFAALSGLDDKSASFIIAGEPKRISLEALAESWNGEYTVLWRPPPGYRAPIVPGRAGAANGWLAEQLAQISGSANDATLQRGLKTFQLAEGLQPDGIAGPKTIIRLTARSDSATPRLMK